MALFMQQQTSGHIVPVVIEPVGVIEPEEIIEKFQNISLLDTSYHF